MRRTLCVVVVALCCLLVGRPSAIGQDAAPTKIGVVDINKVLQEYSGTKDLLKEYKSKISELKVELDQRDKEIEDKRNRIEEQSLMLTEGEKEKQEQEIKSLDEARKKYMSEKNAELAPDKRLLEKTVEEALEEKIRPSIRRLGEREGYTLIVLIPNDGILYYAATVDVTNQVLIEAEK